MSRRQFKRMLRQGVPLETVFALMGDPEPPAPAGLPPDWSPEWKPPKPQRVICGAKTRQGRPCIRRSVPGKRRCPNHGGLSTGPKTAAGKARVAGNLPWQRKMDLGQPGD